MRLRDSGSDIQQTEKFRRPELFKRPLDSFNKNTRDKKFRFTSPLTRTSPLSRIAKRVKNLNFKSRAAFERGAITVFTRRRSGKVCRTARY
jgi:hypothetical protein